MRIEVPELDYDAVRRKAAAFLSKYHPDGGIPVPIDRIIEYKIGLDIIPIPNLYRTHRLSAYLSADMRSIVVDNQQLDGFYPKCRFSLAHEVGHYMLHQECYADAHFGDAQEYFDWYLSLDKVDLWQLERQANWFAGVVLVPTSLLERECRRILTDHRRQIRKLEKVSDGLWGFLADAVAREFGVNGPVVFIRMEKEKIADCLSYLIG